VKRPVLILAIGLASLALPASTVAAAKDIRVSTIMLGESNGYEVELSAVSFNKRRSTATVTATRETAGAGYTVRTPNGAGIHATFGSVGQADLSFQRRKKVVERPERNCRWIIETGVFRGSFRFPGEGGYLGSEAVNPEGVVFRLPDGFCGLRSFRPGLPPGLFPTETVLAARALTPRGKVDFRASRLRTKRGPILFSTSAKERVEGMRVTRSAEVPGRVGDFTATGTSRGAASPPLPFSGSARFRDPRDGPATWVGTLAVSLPGLEQIPLTGESFTARLCPHLSFLARCLPRPDRPRQRSRYGSGSHSQPLALARLSSLR